MPLRAYNLQCEHCGVYFIRNIFFIAAVTKQLSNVTVSNGMAWSPDWTKMYYIDTFVKKLYSFDYDESAATEYAGANHRRSQWSITRNQCSTALSR